MRANSRWTRAAIIFPFVDKRTMKERRSFGSDSRVMNCRSARDFGNQAKRLSRHEGSSEIMRSPQVSGKSINLRCRVISLRVADDTSRTPA